MATAVADALSESVVRVMDVAGHVRAEPTSSSKQRTSLDEVDMDVTCDFGVSFSPTDVETNDVIAAEAAPEKKLAMLFSVRITGCVGVGSASDPPGGPISSVAKIELPGNGVVTLCNRLAEGVCNENRGDVGIERVVEGSEFA